MKPTDVYGWLVDTHALLWMLYGDKRLSPKARKIIDGGLLRNEVSALFSYSELAE